MARIRKGDIILSWDATEELGEFRAGGQLPGPGDGAADLYRSPPPVTWADELFISDPAEEPATVSLYRAFVAPSRSYWVAPKWAGREVLAEFSDLIEVYPNTGREVVE